MRICVFCGSSRGSKEIYFDAARQLGTVLARRGIGVVYGGGNTGLMGAVADGALAAGGEVLGVIPRSMVEREVAHRGLTQLEIVETMHERKARMAELADGFIAMPGGYGTLDEFCEILTWAQLGLHDKPCALWNFEGYFDHLAALFDHAVAEGFLKQPHRELVIVETELERLLGRLDSRPVVPPGKW